MQQTIQLFTMKYFIRALKYFVTLVIILTLIILALVAFKFVEGDISTMFVHGYDSLWQMALMLLAFSALYPRFGFSRRNALAPGSPEEKEGPMKAAMEANGYVLEKQEGQTMSFIKSSVVSRLLKMWEDRITVTGTATGYELEGLTRDLSRLVAAIESRCTPAE